MNFEVMNEFKAGHVSFEVGNRHDSDKLQGIEVSDVERWHRAGFVKAEGMGEAVALNPNHVEVAPRKVATTTVSTEG
ncbi:hypothetical protein [Teredinibacter purpureus]|uniref:hypothetical protein n=1 Tax=Teredinibacter purpureus TaxID=2731756 RepID=UPI0005F80A94|nr:hypothetical protein [Teredinibacter purpureus]